MDTGGMCGNNSYLAAFGAGFAAFFIVFFGAGLAIFFAAILPAGFFAAALGAGFAAILPAGFFAATLVAGFAAILPAGFFAAILVAGFFAMAFLAVAVAAKPDRLRLSVTIAARSTSVIRFKLSPPYLDVVC
jgi:hypothetical protein